MTPVVRRRWIIGVIAALAAIAIVVVVLFAVRPGGSPVAGGSATATVTPTIAPSPTSSPTDAGAGAVLPEFPATALDQPAAAPNGLTASIVSLESVEGEAIGAGDVGGPAIRVTVRLTNGTQEAFDTSLTVVNGYSGAERNPAGTLAKPGGKPFSGSIDPGASQDAVFLFTIPEDARGDVTITVDYQAGQPAFVFQGDATTPF
ncbi:MAG TPA: hypothetical protein VNJ54_16040 [Plantibacter sp.]|uniref:hypothetical protein n=1 Tax=Plantibacter sp. TaxID=1871045 RepID=UPI002CA0D625|nr:hypothetical protein [Plantibacter sp.]